MTHHDQIPDFVKMIIGTATSVVLFVYNKLEILTVPPMLNEIHEWANAISPLLSCVAAVLTISIGIKNLLKKKKQGGDNESGNT